jgi:regulator of sigma E protease
MLEKIAIFVLFLGPLVFFHELGHFLFARLFGVRVEVFSIGFGPKIFNFKRGDTVYAISLIPLGGYVKMYGDDPLRKDEVPEEERKYSFTFKNKWQRFWIVMGGPLANFILAYFLFWGLLFVGERVPEVKVGLLKKESVLYEKGLRTGDVIRRVNGEVISGPTDMVLSTKSQIETLTVMRNDSKMVLTINKDSDDFLKEFMKYPPVMRVPILISESGKKYILSTNKETASFETSLEEMFTTGQQYSGLYLFEFIAGKERKAGELFKEFSGSYGDIESFYRFLGENNLRTLDLVVRNATPNSPAQEAGIKEGDILKSLNGTNIFSFEDLRNTLQDTTGDTVSIELWRSGKLMSLTLKPEVKSIAGEKLKLIGVYSNGEFLPIKQYETGSRGFWGSTTGAVTRSIDTVDKIFVSFKKLIVGESSLKNIGGPLAIGKVASDSFNTSISNFFKLMALISIHLGIINLFPIPVLDGGHILFIFLELINGGPLSRRKMEVAQQFGLSVLLMLMVGAIYNDVSHFF